MGQLKFTTRVLGPLAAFRLEQHQVTQTLRSHTSNVVQSILTGELRVDNNMQVTLDGRMIGLARYVSMGIVSIDTLTIDDAQRGGFDSISELALALKKAGYRFKPIDEYRFYRIQFTWLEAEYA